MKAVVFLLALLAALKIGYQEYMLRVATTEIIVSAYRERAVNACQRDGQNPRIAPGIAWAKSDSVKLVIGKSNLDVYFWQVDHELWNARFKNPYLFLVAGDRSSKVYCEFDIVHGAATIYRM
jgi:hypothetical protein